MNHSWRLWHINTLDGKPVSFQLYGMEYTPTTEFYRHGDKIESIPAGEQLERNLRYTVESALTANQIISNLEYIAVSALKRYFHVISTDCESSEITLVKQALQSNLRMVSLPYGSLCALSTDGDVHNLVCKDPRDILVLNRVLKQFNKNSVLVEVGSVSWGIAEKLGFDIAAVENNYALLTRTNDNQELDFDTICKDLIQWRTSIRSSTT